MSADTTAAAASSAGVEDLSLQRPPSVWRSLVRSGQGQFGLGVGLILLLIIVLGPYFAPFSPDAIAVGKPLSGPSADHWMGTDQLGRDVFSRWLFGGRSVILAPLVAVAIALVLGGALGMLAAYRGGAIDTLVSRIFDVFITVPPLLLVLVLISGLGTSTTILVVTVALVFAPRVGRVVRGASQAVVTGDYIASAQARGESTAAILVREVMPNIAGPVIADTALRITYAIIFVASLNFLGLGLQPPASDWGLMVAESRAFLSTQPWATVWAAVGIAALSVAFNMVADAISTHITRTGGGAR